MREMKNSGVEWIGEIPATWTVSKLKNYIKCYDGRRVPIDSAKRVSGPYPYWGAGSITDYVDDYLFDEELILLGEDGAPFFDDARPVAFLINEKIWANNHIHVIKPLPLINASFLVNYLNIVDYGTYINGSILSKLTQSNMNNISLVVPSLEEQHRIADFLDEKCAKIDAVIEKQKQVIEKLKEYKLSVITEAVTRGLDPTVPMKDSGVEWIGEVPEGWKITKLSRVCKTSSGSTPARNKDNEYFLDDAKIRWVRTLDLNDGLVYDSSEKISNAALLNSSCSIMPKDTVCVAMYGGSGTIGKCGILQKESATNQAICSIVCDNEIINPYFMLYQMLSVKKYWMKFAVGTRKDPNISQEIVANAIIVVPSLNEQSEIIEYLNNKCDIIDSSITKKQAIIEKLTEYKKSLIYEVVTGKREV